MFPLTLALAALASTLPVALRAAIDWIAPTPEELAAKASTIQPDAGAEVLYRLKQIDDSEYNDPVTDEYVRIKIYNDSGVQALSKVDIPYDDRSESIKNLVARVIKPDGKIINVEKKAFYDREVVKLGNVRLHVRSFSFPALEPGAIVEYKFRRAADSNILMLRLDFVNDMPARRVLFRIKPAPLISGWSTRGYFHLCDARKLDYAKDGFNCMEMTNVKAGVDEPYMPPADDVRPWMVFYPTFGNPRDYWGYLAQGLSEIEASSVKKGAKLVPGTAADITRGIDSVQGRVDALNDYCRSQILNIELNPPPGPRDSKLWPKDLRSLDDVIKTKKGRTVEIQMLFVALAKSLGFEASPALCARRSNGVFTEELPSIGQLPDRIAAVNFLGEWHFYDPARREVDTGLLHWDNIGQTALIAQNDGFYWRKTPVTPPEKSRSKRTANLQLDEDGTLSGHVRIELIGQAACDARQRYMQETQAKIEEKARDGAQARMPGAELSNVTATSGAADALKPFVLTYNVRVPNYAERSGQRIFVQPRFFTKGEEPWFTADKRTYPICFNYSWLYEDDVSIKMPAGYHIEAGAAPDDFNRTQWGRYSVTLGTRPKAGEIVYARIFEFTPMLMPASKYDVIKQIFDFIHTQDTHVLTLRKDD